MSKRNRHSKSGGNQIPIAPTISVPTYRAFTIKHGGLANRIVTDVGVTPAFDPKDYPDKEPPYKIIHKKALWDTGATGSVITAATAKELNLTPVGVANMSHAAGVSPTNTYLVNFFLPNMVMVTGALVSECANSGFDAIVGMDIISKGDLSITNANNTTWMSFRIPSIHPIDYVKEYNYSQGISKKK